MKLTCRNPSFPDLGGMLKSSSWLILLWLTLGALPARSQGLSIIRSDLSHAGKTGLSLVQAPLGFNRAQWLEVGGTAAITITLFVVDRDLKHFFLDKQSSVNDAIFSLDDFHGSKLSVLTTLSIYGYGFITKNNKLRHLGLQATEAVAYSGAMTTVLKAIIGRRRPFAGEDQLVFRSFNNSTDDTYLSLPSGHTTVAFAVSTVLADYSDNKIWKTVCYGSAALVGGARIYHDRHWASDVFLGGMIGYKVGKFVISQDHITQVSRVRLELIPSILSRGMQIVLRF